MARKLGWRYCDRSILNHTAQVLGLDVVALRQQEERPDRLWENILCLLGTGTPEATYAPPPDLPVYSKDLFAQESRIMARILDREATVLVAGAASWRSRTALTLHVHVQADLEFRVRRLVDIGRAASPKEAQKPSTAPTGTGPASSGTSPGGTGWTPPTSTWSWIPAGRGSRPASSASWTQPPRARTRWTEVGPGSGVHHREPSPGSSGLL